MILKGSIKNSKDPYENSLVTAARWLQ